MSINERILAQIQEFKGNDYDQRSALGMTRSWLDNGYLDTWSPERHKDMTENKGRDQLAKDLVAICEELKAKRPDVLVALREARAWVNAPFFDPTMNGAQSRKTTMKPGAAKKMREKEEK